MTNLKYFAISGSPYELGLQLGAFGRSIVHNYLIHSHAWKKLMGWRNHPSVTAMKQLVFQHFPEIWQEIQGLADGLSLPFEEVFIWNARGDLWAQAPDGCSSILQNSPYPRSTHNEDGDPSFYGYCGIAHVRPNSSAEFISFVYPGSIPGHTFALNQYQLSITVNNIRALSAQKGIPRMVLCRAALNCPDHQTIIELLTKHPRSGAFNLNIIDVNKQVLSIEFNDSEISIHRIDAPYFHANHAIHTLMRDYPQCITGSSGYRQLQGNYLINHPHWDHNPLTILGDTNHKYFPIYRRQENDTDNENTIATVDFQYNDDNVHWTVYDDPHHTPIFSFINLSKIPVS